MAFSGTMVFLHKICLKYDKEISSIVLQSLDHRQKSIYWSVCEKMSISGQKSDIYGASLLFGHPVMQDILCRLTFSYL